MRNRNSLTIKVLATTAAFIALSAGSATAAPVSVFPTAGTWAPADVFSCKAHPSLPYCGWGN